MARDVEEVGNRVMNGDEALQVSLRLEALHGPLSPSDWLVGVLCPVIEAFVGSMLDTGHDLAFRGVIGSELVGHHHARRTALALQQLTHQAFSCLGIAAALHQSLQHKSVLIHGAPQLMLLALDGNHSFVEMPLVTEPAG